jgi:hypothetical protein
VNARVMHKPGVIEIANIVAANNSVASRVMSERLTVLGKSLLKRPFLGIGCDNRHYTWTQPAP